MQKDELGTEPDAFEVATSDGVRLRGFRYGKGGGRAIVFAHGFNTHQRVRTITGMAHRLARLAPVYTFDFRGHGLSDGTSVLGLAETEDLDAIVRLARREGHERVVSIGASMGGAVALRHAAARRNVVAVVSISAPSGLNGPSRPRARVVWSLMRSRPGRNLMRRLGTMVDIDAQPEPVTAVAGSISPIPVVLIHGDRDPYIARYEADEIFEALKEPKRLIGLPRFGHAEAAFDATLASILEETIDGLLSTVGPDGPG